MVPQLFRNYPARAPDLQSPRRSKSEGFSTAMAGKFSAGLAADESVRVAMTRNIILRLAWGKGRVVADNCVTMLRARDT